MKCNLLDTNLTNYTQSSLSTSNIDVLFSSQEKKLKKPPKDGSALFQEENWHKIKQENPDLTTGKDIHQKAQEEWSNLPQDQQQVRGSSTFMGCDSGDLISGPAVKFHPG